MKILFCKISAMKYYKGASQRDVPYNGGSYVNENGFGHEQYNFAPVQLDDGQYCCLGFVETKTTSKFKRNDLHIEKISDCELLKKEDSVYDVLVVWCATTDLNETSIVGWYKDATVLAQDFSDFIIGAHIRYNVIFSEYKDEEMLQEWGNWRNAFIARKFDLDAILSRISCNTSTQKFCKDFMELTYRDHLEEIDELIIFREKAVKGDRAKLCKPTEYRYNYDRPVHFYRLDFRFGTAKTIIRDIILGLEG